MDEKPRYLLRSSPLVAGGKARLMSNKKVKPSRAKARDVTGDEVHGYTDQMHKALEDLEALTEDDYQRHIAAGAAFRDRTLKQQQLVQIQQARSCLTLEQRLVEVQRVAKMRHINVKGEVEAVKGMLDRAKAGGRKEPSAAEWKVEKLEARLDARYLPDAA